VHNFVAGGAPRLAARRGPQRPLGRIRGHTRPRRSRDQVEI